MTVPVEATDPRASGTYTNVEDFAEDTNDGRYRAGGTSVRVVNDGGTWVGTSRTVAGSAVAGGDDVLGAFSELTGEGRYEGLSMYLFRMFGPEVEATVGFIVPTGLAPAMPPPPAAE